MDILHHKAQQPGFSSRKSDSLPDFCKTPRRLTDNIFLLKCSVTWFCLHHSLQLTQQLLLHSTLNRMVLVQKRYIALTPKHKTMIPKRFSYLQVTSVSWSNWKMKVCLRPTFRYHVNRPKSTERRGGRIFFSTPYYTESERNSTFSFKSIIIL